MNSGAGQPASGESLPLMIAPTIHGNANAMKMLKVLEPKAFETDMFPWHTFGAAYFETLRLAKRYAQRGIESVGPPIYFSISRWEKNPHPLMSQANESLRRKSLRS